MEAAGDRWWPIFGATYMIKAIKRVRGMRLSVRESEETCPRRGPRARPPRRITRNEHS